MNGVHCLSCVEPDIGGYSFLGNVKISKMHKNMCMCIHVFAREYVYVCVLD